MGRRNSPAGPDVGAKPVSGFMATWQRWHSAIPATVMFCLSVAYFVLSGLEPIRGAGSALAQTLNQKLAAQAAKNTAQPDQMVVNAAELVYDQKKDSVSAQGNVQIYYRGRVLQADRVIYNRSTKRVFAEGRVKITETDGTVAYGKRAEITDDFKNGFIDSLRARSADNTHFTARRTERSGGEATVFYNGTYTACEPCKKDPSKPPFWRVRAKRIIHKNSEQTIYYEDAVFELWGQPIAWLPFFSMADPTVRRKSGFLIPRYATRSRLGFGASIPYFFALAPNYDLTVTPTLLSKQGLFGQVEWRHRLVNGSYRILASGIFQRKPREFANPPYGPGNRRFRGSIDTDGKFYINTKWSFGWQISVLSDRWFRQDYRLPSTNLSQNYLRTTTSTIYLNGQGRNGYFDLRGYYFQSLTRGALPAQQPIVTPVFDYNKTVDINRAASAGIGGRLELDFSFVKLTRQLAAFEAIGGRRLDRAYSLYDVCETAAGAPNYNRTSCLLRGMAGDYARASFLVEWKRKMIDPLGQVWTPFVFAQFNGTWLNLDTTGGKLFSNPTCTNPVTAGPFAGQCASAISNSFQSIFFQKAGTTFRGTAKPGAGVEYRYPFVALTGAVTHVLEPIVHIIARPNESRDRLRVNEDAQSLVFDDTSLFSRKKFSGYDRIEGGTRIDYGFKYTASFSKGGYANIMVGQSFQLAGRNSYKIQDAANAGLGSGLDKRRSDVVARVAFAPNSHFNVIAKTRYDPSRGRLRRIDVMANLNAGNLRTTLHYARYTAQPLIGFDQRREGLLAGARYKINGNFSVNGNIIFDLSRHLYNGVIPSVNAAPLFSVAGLGVGATYSDECTTLAVRYSSILQANGAGENVRNQTLLFSLQLRTVGDTSISPYKATSTGAVASALGN